MKAKIIGVSGGAQLSEFDLIVPVILGRGRRAGLLVQQSLVSRQHCELYELDGKLMIRDLGSTNGTRVNQVKIEEPVELLSGDLLTVGAVTFRVDCGDNRGTISDARDETAVELRSDFDQRSKISAGASSAADALNDDRFNADDLDDVKYRAVLPIGIAQQSLPTNLDSVITESQPVESEKRSETFLRNLQ